MFSTLYGEGGSGIKGIRSFWRGNGIAIFKMTPEMALRQGIFETFRELRGDYDEIVRESSVQHRTILNIRLIDYFTSNK